MKRYLVSALLCMLVVPAIFYLRFGGVDGLGWGMKIFLAAFCALSGIGLYFLPRKEYHTPVALHEDWLDRIGAFWLMACVFGPVCVWILNALIPLTAANWRWLYALQVLLSIVLPTVTALPLLRYVRGKAARIALPILIGVTMLPVWIGSGPLMDVLAGPTVKQVETVNQPGVAPDRLILRYTGRELAPGSD